MVARVSRVGMNRWNTEDFLNSERYVCMWGGEVGIFCASLSLFHCVPVCGSLSDFIELCVSLLDWVSALLTA